jgi:DNA invertase Pin-like site-specific DNA recombinase
LSSSLTLDVVIPEALCFYAAPGDEFTARMFAALNAMMLGVLAAVARTDYEDRRRRQAQGIVRAKAVDAYRGRREDVARNTGIRRHAAFRHVLDGHSTGDRLCSRATIAKRAEKRRRETGVARVKVRLRRRRSAGILLEHFPFTLHRILRRRGSWRILAG